MLRFLVSLASLVAFLSLQACATGARSPYADLRMNQVQVIGSHNSYKIAPQPELLSGIRDIVKNEGDHIDYNHLRLTDQLNLGLRNLEIDIYHDPEGGRYSNPLGNRLLRAKGIEPWPLDDPEGLKAPGFKILHDADFDFRGFHSSLEGALDELLAWSNAHAAHEPVLITMNLKHGKSKVPGAAQPGEFDAAALGELNNLLLTRLGSHILTPDAVRGNNAMLRETILTRGWPTIASAAGKFYFVLDETDQVRDTYITCYPGLHGAAYFVDVSEDSPNAAIFVLNEPQEQANRIHELVKKGFIVRTRADADTEEARRGDYSRFEAAKSSGAQAVTTDYYIPDRKIHPRYQIRFDGGTCIRENPVTGPAAK